MNISYKINISYVSYIIWYFPKLKINYEILDKNKIFKINRMKY